MKKILSAFLSTSLMVLSISTAAAGNPVTVFEIDCDTQEKQVSIGYQSDPDNIQNGPEIIALKYTFEILPAGASTFDDIKDATLMGNPAFANFIVAENTKTQNVGSVEIKFAGGFTGGNGVSHATDLIFVKGINQKAFLIRVKEGELYPKNSTENIYQNTNESFVANPESCGNNANTDTNTTNTNTNTNTTETTETTLSISADKETANTGDVVTVTALINNRNGQSVDWSQTSGAQITPQINNEELAGNVTKSTLVFTMVESNQNIVLKLLVGTATGQTTIRNASATQNAAPVESETPTNTNVGESAASLQERLQQRREELNAQATQNAAPTPTQTAGNIHGAAGSLSESGPAETGLLILMSFAIALGWKKLKRSEVHVDV